MNAIGYGKVEEIKASTPPNLDILLVEQEVQASDEITAVQMVVMADTKRTALLEEAKDLERKIEEGGLKYCPASKLDPETPDDFSVGAKCVYYRSEHAHARKEKLGVAATVVSGPDEFGDYTVQTPFDADGEIAGRLSDVYEELADIGTDSAEVVA